MKRFLLLIWYLKRPQMMSHLFCRIFHRSGQDERESTRTESEKWADEIAISQEEAVAQMLGGESSTPIYELCADEMKAAHAAADACPIRMGGPGVACGWSSLALLLSVSQRDGTVVNSYMPCPGRNNDACVGSVVPLSLRKFWKLLRTPDRQSLPKALSILGESELCHYDSGESYDGRMWAYPLLSNALRKQWP